MEFPWFESLKVFSTDDPDAMSSLLESALFYGWPVVEASDLWGDGPCPPGDVESVAVRDSVEEALRRLGSGLVDGGSIGLRVPTADGSGWRKLVAKELADPPGVVVLGLVAVSDGSPVSGVVMAVAEVGHRLIPVRARVEAGRIAGVRGAVGDGLANLVRVLSVPGVTGSEGADAL